MHLSNMNATTIATRTAAQTGGSTKSIRQHASASASNEPDTLATRFAELAYPTLHAARVCEMSKYTQHGNTSCLEHCIAVAYYSLAYVRKHHIRCDEASLVRGALLHDYFLYDWHDPEPWHRLHGFRHPYFALRNAERDFELSPIERDLIVHHMFPLVPLPPHTREGIIVCMVDKACSLRETFCKPAYAGLPSMRATYVVAPVMASAKDPVMSSVDMGTSA